MTSPKDELYLSAEAKEAITKGFHELRKKLQDTWRPKANYLATLPDVGDSFTANDDGRAIKQKTMDDGQKALDSHNALEGVFETLEQDWLSSLKDYGYTDDGSGTAIEKTTQNIPGGH